MISLRKHIESYAGELAKAALCAYREILNSVARTALQVTPPLGAELSEKLNLVRANIPENVTPGELTALQQSVDLELAKWGEDAAQRFSKLEKEIKDVMIALAATAAAAGERDTRYCGQFSGLTTKLRSVARLEDLSSMRQSVLESATELTAVVRKMNEENEQSISQLRAEVVKYRAKLAQSEARGATDPLTGLANRREIEAQIEERILWKSSFCLAMLDLDGFKKVNDIHGHTAGDSILKQFAAELRGQVRYTDVVGRWAGDEFVVIVDSDLKEAQVRIDRIRDWVFGDYELSTGKGAVKIAVGASVGLAEWDGKETAAELFARADQQMYAVKKWSGMARSGVA